MLDTMKRNLKYLKNRTEIMQPDDPSIRYIPLTDGQYAIVDAEDYPYLSQFNWNAHWKKELGGYYARRVIEIRMHREVLNAPDGVLVDHIVPQSTLDNRKSNLRFATHAQNRANTRLRSDSQSGYIGVQKVYNRYRAYISDPSRTPHRRNLGSFKLAEDAARIRDRAAIEAYGEFAQLNFPLSDYM